MPDPRVSNKLSLLVAVLCLWAAPPPAATSADLSIDQVEVTQGLPWEKGELPLVRHKPTVVRVFPKVAGQPQLVNVSARLHGSRGGTELPGSPLAPDRGTVTVDGTVDRWSDREALIFELPDRWLADDLELWVEAVAPDGLVDAAPANDRYPRQGTLFLRYQESGELSIRFVVVRYQAPANGNQFELPDSRVRRRDAVEWLEAVFPLAPGAVDYRPWRTTELLFRNPPHQVKLNGSALITELDTLWGNGATPDLIFAWTPEGSYPNNGSSDPWYGAPFLLGRPGMARVAFANDDSERYRRTLAHEAAHNLGLNCHHDRRLGDGVCGYDVTLVDPERRGVMCADPEGGTLFDLMKPGKKEAQAWIVPWTYVHLMQALASPDERKEVRCHSEPSWSHDATPVTPEASLDADVEKLLAVRGEITEEGGAFFPFHRVPASEAYLAAAATVPDAAEGSHEIRFLDEDGRLLRRIRWTPPTYRDDSEEPPPSTPFLWFLPEPAGVTTVQLLSSERVLELLEVPPEAPEVEEPRHEEPPGGLSLYGESLREPVTVSWSARSPGPEPGSLPFDSPPLSHRLWFSNDDGASWIPVAANLTGEEVAVDVDQAVLPGGERCRFKVTTSDGYRETEEVGEPFFLPDRRPTAEIVLPRMGAMYRQGQELRLVGRGDDSEDGPLTGDQLRWHSDVDGTLGSGEELWVELEPERHEITLVAVDSAGNESDPAVVVLEIQSEEE